MRGVLPQVSEDDYEELPTVLPTVRLRPKPPIRFVYVAGPLSKPSELDNIHTAVRWGDKVMEAGLIPLIPHLDALWHMISPKSYETWIAWCLAWVTRCDAVLRVPGASTGADREVACAQEHNMPVFYGEEGLNALREINSKINRK